MLDSAQAALTGDTKLKLLVRARGTASVPDILAMEAGMKRFIGRRPVYDFGPDKVLAFVPTNENQEIPPLFEYKRAVKEGELWAANQETAVECGVVFDPKFGVPDAEKASK
mgnify:CR=1 FL=1